MNSYVEFLVEDSTTEELQTMQANLLANLVDLKLGTPNAFTAGRITRTEQELADVRTALQIKNG